MQIIHVLLCTFVWTVCGTKYKVLAGRWGHCVLLVYTQPSRRQHLSVLRVTQNTPLLLYLLWQIALPSSSRLLHMHKKVSKIHKCSECYKELFNSFLIFTYKINRGQCLTLLAHEPRDIKWNWQVQNKQDKCLHRIVVKRWNSLARVLCGLRDFKVIRWIHRSHLRAIEHSASLALEILKLQMACAWESIPRWNCWVLPWVCLSLQVSTRGSWPRWDI